MGDEQNLHGADGSFLGFLFQIERALDWLSSSSIDAVVGVEVDDDITVKLNSGENIRNIYEQAKHSISKKIPYADRSEDLWKTLSIWVEAVVSKRFDVGQATFSFLTNKRIPASRLISTLDREHLLNEGNLKHKNKEIISLADDLKVRASTLPKSLKTYGQVIVDCPVEVLILVIDRITVLDNTYMHKRVEMKNKLISNLSMSTDIPFDYMYQSLFGFVVDTLMVKWRNKEPGWITVKAFNQQYTQLLAEYKKKSFFEKTIDSLPVDKGAIEKNRGKLFVEQLSRIGCNEDEIIEAIHDFVRAASERSRFANDGEISKQKFDLYFEDLFNHWKSISRPIFKYAKPGDHIQVGYEVYYKSLLYKGMLNNYQPEQGYTHKGSFHFLANEPRLGWHPNWETLIDSNDETK